MADPQGQNQLFDFLRALKRRRRQILVPALLFVSLGFSYAVIVPKKYRLSTRIEIASDATQSDPRLKTTQEIAVRREAPAVSDHIRHYARVKEVIDRNLSLWPEYVNCATDEERQRLIKDIVDKNLVASSTAIKTGTIFVDISYSDETKERAAKFLEDLTASWLLSVAESDRDMLMQERAKLQKIVDDLAADLKEKESQLYKLILLLGKDPSASSGNGQREESGDWTFKALDRAKTELTDVLTQLNSAKLEFEQADLHYQNEPDYKETIEEVAALDRSTEIEERKTELADLEEKIANLRPAYSQYRRLAEKIATLREEIEELETGDPTAAEHTRREKNPRKEEYLLAMRQTKDRVDGLSAHRDQLQADIENLLHETQAKTESYKHLESLANDVAEARATFNATRDEWQERDKSLQMLDSSPRPWRIAQPPMASSATVTPNPWLIRAFSLVAGMALGVGLAVFSEYARSSYRTVGDLAAVMSVPVLGAIQTIVTRREMRRLQLNRAVAGLSTALIVGSIGWITWLWYSAPERLPVEVQDAIEQLRSTLK